MGVHENEYLVIFYEKSNFHFEYMEKWIFLRKRFFNCPHLGIFPLHFGSKYSFNSGNQNTQL